MDLVLTCVGVVLAKSAIWCLLWIGHGGPGPFRVVRFLKEDILIDAADLERYQRIHTDGERIEALKKSVKASLAAHRASLA